jgi:uncharacterized protein (TIRG00374 family)
MRDLPWLVLLEALFFVNLGWFYTGCFRSSGLRAEPLRFTLLASAGNFVNLVSKSSGFGALALFLAEGRRRGDSRPRIILAFGASYALGEVAFLVVLCIAAAALYLNGTLTLAEGAAIGVVLALMAATGAGLVAALRSRGTLQRLYLFAQTPRVLISRLLRRTAAPDEEQAMRSATEVFEAVQLILQRRRGFALPFLSALGVELMSALFLWFSADLLGIPLSPENALAGYAISLVFTILSVTPGGLGFAESSLIVFLGTTGLQRQDAIALTLVYRLFTYWLPLAIGALSLLFLQWRDVRSEPHKLPK